MRLRVRVDNVELELEHEDKILEALNRLGFKNDLDFLDRAVPTHKVVESAPSLRTPPSVSPGVRDGVVQCQECGEDIAPLDEDAAIELFGIVACLSCGKEIQ